jgi:hypothetical protein
MQNGTMDAQSEPYHALPRAKVLERFEVTVSSGLTLAEAVQRVKEYWTWEARR